MGVFDRFRTKAAPKVKAHSEGLNVAKVTNPAELSAWMRDGGGGTYSGQNVNVSNAMRVAAVYRCVSILSDIAASAPIHIKNKETLVRRSPDDELVYILNDMANDRTGSRMPAFALRKLMDTHKLLRGNGYARIIRGFKNQVIGLKFMHSAQVEPCQRSDGTVEYVYTTLDGKQITLPQDDVLHVMGPSLDGIKGMSVLDSARNQIGFSMATEKHSSALFKNGTNIGDILSSTGSLSPEVVEALRESLQEYRSPENAHKTLILQGGLTHDKVGMTQADAEFVLSRKLGIIEICMFFGVPPHIVGFTENQTSYGQGVEHQGIAFVNFSVNGVYSGWEAAIKLGLLVGNRHEFVEMDDGKLLRGDAKSRWESHKIGRETGVLNANDVLRAEGLPQRDGGEGYWTQPNLAKEAKHEPSKTTKD